MKHRYLLPQLENLLCGALKVFFPHNHEEEVIQRENKVKPPEPNDIPQAQDEHITLLEEKWEESEDFYSYLEDGKVHIVYRDQPYKVPHNPEDKWNNGKDIFSDNEVNNKASSHPQPNSGPPEDKISVQPEINPEQDKLMLQPKVNPERDKASAHPEVNQLTTVQDNCAI